MKDSETIARLLHLRRRREQRSEEVVLRRRGAARRAAGETGRAADAIDAHREWTAAEEQATFEALRGRPVTTRSLLQVEAKFERAAGEAVQLESRHAAASAAEAERKAELASASDEHRRRRKAVARLDELMEQLARRSARRQAAIAELRMEEEAGAPAAPRHS